MHKQTKEKKVSINHKKTENHIFIMEEINNKKVLLVLEPKWKAHLIKLLSK